MSSTIQVKRCWVFVSRWYTACNSHRYGLSELSYSDNSPRICVLPRPKQGRVAEFLLAH